MNENERNPPALAGAEGAAVDLDAELARLPAWLRDDEKGELWRVVGFRSEREAELAGVQFVLGAIAAGWRGAVLRQGSEALLRLVLGPEPPGPGCWAWLHRLEGELPSGLVEASA
jgi:hypothetical protein